MTQPLSFGTGSKLPDKIMRMKWDQLNSPVRVDTERLPILLEVHREFEGQPAIMKRAIFLDRYLSRKTIFIDENPIVGNVTKYKPGAMPYVELSCSWMAKNVDQHCTVGKFHHDGEARKDIMEAVEYWRDRSVYRRARQMFKETTGLDWAQLAKAGIHDDGCALAFSAATTPDTGQIVDKGLNAILTRLDQKLSEMPPTYNVKNIKQRYFYQAARICVNAVIRLSHRYSALASEMAAKEEDPERRRELEKIAETMKWVPANPARNFYEGLQSLWFSLMPVLIESCIPPGFGIGRISDYLYPLYKKDKEEGRITEERAIELLACFFLRIMECCFYASGISSRATQGFNPMRITMGGYTRDGRDATTELDYLLVETQRRLRVIEPGLACYYTDKMPEDFLVRCVELIRDTGMGQPQFHNADNCLERWFYNYDISPEDARETSLHSCVVSGISHRTGPPWEGAFHMSKMVELALNNGADPVSGIKAGPETGEAEQFRNYGELHEAVKKQLSYCLERARLFDTIGFTLQSEIVPCPYISCFIDDCIEKGLDLTEGGARYGEMGPIIVGNIDLANSLAAIKRVVFEERRISIKQMKDALAANFEGYEEIQRMLLDAPKYGNDDEYVDSIAKDWFSIFYEEARKHPDCVGQPVIPLAYSHSLHLLAGQQTGALPSGRKAGLALCDGSVSAQPGTDRNGPTALARSAASVVDTLRFGSNHLNMKFHPSTLRDRQSVGKLLALIKSYFDLGGYHIQFNCLGDETLRDAQLHPENYRDLVVRVSGFSALYIHLDKGIQDEIIRRTTLNLED